MNQDTSSSTRLQPPRPTEQLGLSEAPDSTDLTLSTLNPEHTPGHLRQISFTGLTPKAVQAIQATHCDRDQLTEIRVDTTKISIIDPRELLDRISYARAVKAQVFDGTGTEILDPVSFVASYCQTLLGQLSSLGVFKKARHTVYDTVTRVATDHQGLSPDRCSIENRKVLVWIDCQVEPAYQHLHSAQTNYCIQRLCTAASYQRPNASRSFGPKEEESEKVAFFKLPFPSSIDSSSSVSSVHVALSSSALITIRGAEIGKLDEEFKQFVFGGLDSSGCILENILTRASHAVKQSRDALWQQISEIEEAQRKKDTPIETLLRRLSQLEDTSDEILNLSSGFMRRLTISADDLKEIFPNKNFASRWKNSWSQAVDWMENIISRITQERSQIEATLQARQLETFQRESARSRITSTALTVLLGAATILQSATFFTENGSISPLKAAIAGGVLVGMALLFWGGVSHQAKISNGVLSTDNPKKKNGEN